MAGDADQGGDLRPVADFVNQDMRNEFARRDADAAARENFEFHRAVPAGFWLAFNVGGERAAAMEAEVEQGIDVRGRFKRGIGERSAGEAVDVMFFGDEDVEHQFADGADAAAVVWGGRDREARRSATGGGR